MELKNLSIFKLLGLLKDLVKQSIKKGNNLNPNIIKKALDSNAMSV
jgi:hypothetical protein